jgi:hypothetical protein
MARIRRMALVNISGDRATLAQIAAELKKRC